MIISYIVNYSKDLTFAFCSGGFNIKKSLMVLLELCYDFRYGYFQKCIKIQNVNFIFINNAS